MRRVEEDGGGTRGATATITNLELGLVELALEVHGELDGHTVC
jgi:hypothetical protein